MQTVRPPGGAFVLRGRTLYRLPRPSLLGIPQTWRGLAGYALLSPAARVRLAIEPWIPARPDRRDESIGSFFRRRFGAASVDLIAQPLLGGIHAGDIETLSMQSLFPRLLETERVHGSILRAPISPSAASPRPSCRFAAVSATLVQALERSLDPGTIRFEAPVHAIERNDLEWRLARGRHRGARGDRRQPGPRRRHAARADRRRTPRRCAGRCRTCPPPASRSRGRGRPSRIRSPEPASSWLVVTATSASRRARGCRPSGRIARRRTRRSCARSSAGRTIPTSCRCPTRPSSPSSAPISSASWASRPRRRWRASTAGRNAGAQHTVGHLSRVEEIERRLAVHGGLFVAGSGFRAVGIPDCVTDARNVAAQARGTFLAGGVQDRCDC